VAVHGPAVGFRQAAPRGKPHNVEFVEQKDRSALTAQAAHDRVERGPVDFVMRLCPEQTVRKRIQSGAGFVQPLQKLGLARARVFGGPALDGNGGEIGGDTNKDSLVLGRECSITTENDQFRVRAGFERHREVLEVAKADDLQTRFRPRRCRPRADGRQVESVRIKAVVQMETFNGRPIKFHIAEITPNNAQNDLSERVSNLPGVGLHP